MNTLLTIFALATATAWAEPKSVGALAITPECVLAEEWVESNLDALPRTLEAYGKHSNAYRKAIYRALDVEDHISLWKEHVAAVAQEVTSPQQRLFLQTVPIELYVGARPSESDLAAFREQATAILGEELARAAFVTLGGSKPAQDGKGQIFPDCSCEVGGGDCNSGSTCRSHFWIWDVCRDTTRGCGWFGWSGCNGLCYQNQPTQS